MTTAPEPYTPLASAAPFGERLAQFILDELKPELESIRADLSAVAHKADLFRLGHRAISLRMRISEWLAQTERELERKYADAYAALWETSQSQAKEDGARALPVDMLKAQVRQRCGDLVEAKSLLSYFRSDLDGLQSYVQTMVRSMHNEEMELQDGPRPER